MTYRKQIFVGENLYVLMQISPTVTKADDMPLPKPNVTKFSNAYMRKWASNKKHFGQIVSSLMVNP